MRTITAALLSLALASGCGAADRADVFTERAIIDACRQLVSDYAIYRDRFDAVNYAATFAEDGELVLPSDTFVGRAAIAARLEAGAGKTRSRHFMSSQRIEVLDARTARGISYAMIFIEPLPQGHADNEPLPTAAPFAIGEYHDQFVLTERGWKFARREFRPAFSWERQ